MLDQGQGEDQRSGLVRSSQVEGAVEGFDGLNGIPVPQVDTLVFEVVEDSWLVLKLDDFHCLANLKVG